ncbi:unnamed protein product [Tuber aestivum]|uniref:Uncharacterized protein n=1 Tax=Tuber aestivum TaxID=59557 RepID=A0A292PNR1_9PEZI|nr:unnamed protein product [Tuber aestivum]
MEQHSFPSPESLYPPAYLQISPSPSPARMSKIGTRKSPPSRPKTRFDSFSADKPSVNKYRDNGATSPSVSSDLENVSPSSSFKLPPPVITSYSYTPSSSTYATQHSPLHSLQRQTEILTEELQHLLDVQSAELMSGGSLSTSQRPPRNPLYSADQVPREQRITLHQARKRVLLTMRELAEIKGTEEKVYASEVAERETLVKAMRSWGDKASLLEKEIHKIEDGEEGREAQALREAKSEVEREMQGLRIRLSKLEDHHSALKYKLEELESTVSSKTSSYQSSLVTVKQRTSNFLATHRFPSPTTAIESWTLEREALLAKKDQAKVEAEALLEGMVLWDETLSLVYSFEDKLGLLISGRRGGDINLDIMQGLEGVVEALEQKLESAENRGWKLLVCCIGAELEAFREAKEVMKKSLGITSASSSKTSKLASVESGRGEGKGVSQSQDGEDLIGELKERGRARERTLTGEAGGDVEDDKAKQKESDASEGKGEDGVGDGVRDLRGSIFRSRKDYSPLDD